MQWDTIVFWHTKQYRSMGTGTKVKGLLSLYTGAQEAD